MDYFPNVIGQRSLKGKLSFYLDGYYRNRFLPNIGLWAERGKGKTFFATEIARKLIGSHGKPKTFVKLNCRVYRSIPQFFEEVLVPHILNKEATLFLDEIGLLDESIQGILLSILDTTDALVTELVYDGIPYTFNFQELSVIAASTNPEKLSVPLRERFERCELDDYTNEDIQQIILKITKDIAFEENVLTLVAETCRMNPRQTVLRAKNIIQDCLIRDSKLFSVENWLALKKTLEILPKGLTKRELAVLEIIKDLTAVRLNHIAAKLGISATSVQRDIEPYLIRLGLIKIDIEGRKLTNRGSRLLDQISVKTT